MDERMWLLAYDCGLMFGALHNWGEHEDPIGQRRLRLIAVALCRALERHYREDIEAVGRVNLAEQFADGLVPVTALPDPGNELSQLLADWSGERSAALRATWAVVSPYASQAASDCYNSAKAIHVTGPGITYRWMANVVRDVFGNPFRPFAFDPAWRTSTAVALAQGIYDDRAFDRMPILADALQDAGCDNADVLSHCRAETAHARGGWVVDAVLGKA